MVIYKKDFTCKGEEHNNIHVYIDYDSSNKRYTLNAHPELISDISNGWISRKYSCEDIWRGAHQVIHSVASRRSKKTDTEAIDKINIDIILNTICDRFNLKLEN